MAGPVDTMQWRLLWLHEEPQWLTSTASLLNATWPRSQSAREHTLAIPAEAANQLPASLIWIADGRVVAHCRLLPVQAPQGVLIESVVVALELRGKGFGRLVMDQAEERARALGMVRAHLSTHDKEGFYARLGYSRSTAVHSLGKVARFFQVRWSLQEVHHLCWLTGFLPSQSSQHPPLQDLIKPHTQSIQPYLWRNRLLL